MTEALTKNVKYVFLDVEKYSQMRSVEAQVEIIKILNRIVKETVNSHIKKKEDVIYLPTGDGICIALLNPTLAYDVHLLISLDILAKIDNHNRKIDDKMRKFSVRIGINENVDNLVEDVNGKINVTGAGINMSQRIMGLADGNQILLSQSVYETLKYREKYMNSFKVFQAKVKHGININVYQLISSEYPNLNCKIPHEFLSKKNRVIHLTKFVAYYFAHCIKNRNFFVKLLKNSQEESTIVVLLYFLAKDSEGIANSSNINPYKKRIFGKNSISIKEQYEYYDSINYWIINYLADFVNKEMEKYHKFFENADNYIYINQKGIDKLKKEFPDIYDEFELDGYVWA